MTDEYLWGLLTLPLLAAAAWLIYVAAAVGGTAVRRWWLRPVAITQKDVWDRALNASCVFAARRVWCLRLPGSRLMILRSNVGDSDRCYPDTIQMQERANSALIDAFERTEA